LSYTANTNHVTRERLQLAIMAVVVAAPALAVGGVHTIVAIGLLTAFCSYFGIETGSEKTLRLPFFALGFAVAFATCVIQLVPMPPIIHELLNPVGWSIYSEGASLFGVAVSEQSWRPLSLLPHATVDHGTRWLALTVCIFVSADFARRKNGWAWVLRLVILAGLFQLVVGSLQDAFSGGKVLFFYEPASGQLTGFSTFMPPFSLGW
jgi:hypothetical protein